MGKTKFVEQFWRHQGWVLRQPAVEPRGDTRDFTWIATELARRTGLLEKYNEAINRGVCGVSLKNDKRDFALDPAQVHSVDEVWDAVCGRQPRAEQRRRGARPRLVQGTRPDDAAVSADRLVPVPTLKTRACASSCLQER